MRHTITNRIMHLDFEGTFEKLTDYQPINKLVLNLQADMNWSDLISNVNFPGEIDIEINGNNKDLILDNNKQDIDNNSIVINNTNIAACNFRYKKIFFNDCIISRGKLIAKEITINKCVTDRLVLTAIQIFIENESKFVSSVTEGNYLTVKKSIIDDSSSTASVAMFDSSELINNDFNIHTLRLNATSWTADNKIKSEHLELNNMRFNREDINMNVFDSSINEIEITRVSTTKLDLTKFTKLTLIGSYNQISRLLVNNETSVQTGLFNPAAVLNNGSPDKKYNLLFNIIYNPKNTKLTKEDLSIIQKIDTNTLSIDALAMVVMTVKNISFGIARHIIISYKQSKIPFTKGGIVTALEILINDKIIFNLFNETFNISKLVLDNKISKIDYYNNTTPLAVAKLGVIPCVDFSIDYMKYFNLDILNDYVDEINPRGNPDNNILTSIATLYDRGVIDSAVLAKFITTVNKEEYKNNLVEKLTKDTKKQSAIIAYLKEHDMSDEIKYFLSYFKSVNDLIYLLDKVQNTKLSYVDYIARHIVSDSNLIEQLITRTIDEDDSNTSTTSLIYIANSVVRIKIYPQLVFYLMGVYKQTKAIESNMSDLIKFIKPNMEDIFNKPFKDIPLKSYVVGFILDNKTICDYVCSLPVGNPLKEAVLGYQLEETPYNSIIIQRLIADERKKIKNAVLFKKNTRQVDTIYIDTIMEHKTKYNKNSEEHSTLTNIEKKCSNGFIHGEVIIQIDDEITNGETMAIKGAAIHNILLKWHLKLNQLMVESNNKVLFYKNIPRLPNKLYKDVCLMSDNDLVWVSNRLKDSNMDTNRIGSLFNKFPDFFTFRSIVQQYFDSTSREILGDKEIKDLDNYILNQMAETDIENEAANIYGYLTNIKQYVMEEVYFSIKTQSLVNYRQKTFRINLKNLEILKLFKLMPNRIKTYIDNAHSHPVSSRALTVGWVRFETDIDNKSIWINEVQTDMTKICGFEEKSAGFSDKLNNKLSYNVLWLFQHWVKKHYDGYEVIFPSATLRKTMLGGSPSVSNYDNQSKKLNFTKGTFVDTIWVKHSPSSQGVIYRWNTTNEIINIL